MKKLWPLFSLFIELACLLVSLYGWRREKALHWRLMTVYLAFVFVIEASSYGLQLGGSRNTKWLYNLLLPVEAAFGSFFLYRIMFRPGQVIYPWLGFMGLFAVLFVGEPMLSGEGQNGSHLYSYHFLVVCLILGCLYCLWQLHRDPTPNTLWQQPSFLWVAGTLLFYTGGLITFLLFQVLAVQPVRVVGIPLSAYITILLTYFTNILWIISLIYRYRNNNSSGQSLSPAP